MKIVVFDVPAEKGGALTILKQYYEKAKNDSINEWLFVLSTPQFEETENVKIIRIPWVKKSWFHRLYFDSFVAKRIVYKNNADEVLCLQNVIVKGVELYQTLYLHQSLPFVEYRYKMGQNFKFWVYQNVISKMIYKSIKRADKVIVQTQWMKKACIDKTDIDENKVEVKTPTISIEIKKMYSEDNNNRRCFFYPSTGLEYKNHLVIIDAFKKLKAAGYTDYKAIFTLQEDENRYVKQLYKLVKKNELPIEFVGKLSLDEVYEYYAKSILIFPSYIETFGLPLLEAREHNCPIIASDCAFSHEILDGYHKVKFFNPFNSNALTNIILDII